MSIKSADWLGRKVGESRFLIVRSLRDGGMAHVFLGQDMTTGESVIIKAPKVDQVALDANFRQRFLREIQALKKLAHPNVVRILCNGEEAGLPFVVLRFLDGGTLGDRMYTRPDGSAEPQSAEELKTWLPMLADALDYIHAKGYIHRDVKPHNILFDGKGKAFLGDLGIARLVPSDAANNKMTRISEWPVGTPPYMSPEQILSQAVDGRTDQFALAVVVYEWLSARRPYLGDSPEEVLAHQKQPPPPLFLASQKLPMVVSKAVTRALSRKPEDRFATCKEFAAEVINGLDAAETVAPAPRRKPASGQMTAVENNPRSFDGTGPARTNPASNPDTWSVHVPEVEASHGKEVGNSAAKAAAVLAAGRDRTRTTTAAPATKREPAALPSLAPVAKKESILDPLVVPKGDFMITSELGDIPSVSGGASAKRNTLLLRLILFVLFLVIVVASAIAGRIFLPEIRVREKLGVSAAAQPEMAKTEGKAEQRNQDVKSENAGQVADLQEKVNVELARVKVLEEKQAEAVGRASRALEESRAALEKATAANSALEKARGENKELLKKLTESEETALKTKLWFIVKNSTSSTVEFATRCQLWNGQWTDWQERSIKKQDKMSISSEPGSLSIYLRYVPAPGELTEEKQINAQSFSVTKKQSVKNIDCSYAFETSKDGRGLDFKWK